MDNGKRVLVTGGSGFVGTHLLRRLSTEGAQIISVDIRPPKERIFGVEYIDADVRKLSSIDIGSVDQVWNLAAIHTTPGHDDHEYYDTNVMGALEVVKFAESREVLDIVFSSSISVYGPSEEKKTEHSAPEPVSAYGKSKYMAEEIHRIWHASAPGRRLTVVRPAVVFGQGEGGNFARMASLLKKGVFVFPGRRDTIKSCIYVDDLIDVMMAGQKDPDSIVLINASYPECPTLEEIVSQLKERYFPNAKLIDLPREFVLAAAGIVRPLNGVGGIHPDRVLKLTKSTYVYPQWIADRNMLTDGAFTRGLEKWEKATRGSFI